MVTAWLSGLVAEMFRDRAQVLGLILAVWLMFPLAPLLWSQELHIMTICILTNIQEQRHYTTTPSYASLANSQEQKIIKILRTQDNQLVYQYVMWIWTKTLAALIAGLDLEFLPPAVRHTALPYSKQCVFIIDRQIELNFTLTRQRISVHRGYHGKYLLCVTANEHITCTRLLIQVL